MTILNEGQIMGERDIDQLNEHLHEIRIGIATIQANTAQMKERGDDHECRLRSLEQWQWKAIGIATALSFIASLAVAFFAK